MSNHLYKCKIPQFNNPIQVRTWVQYHISKCMNCQLEIKNRRVRELKWIKNMRNKLVQKNILDLELDKYFIPSTPSKSFTRSIPYSCYSDSISTTASISSCDSTKGISEGKINVLDNYYCETISSDKENRFHPRDNCISSDSDEENRFHPRDNCISSDSDEENRFHPRDNCISSDSDEENRFHPRDNCISSNSICGSAYDYISNKETYSHQRYRCMSSVENYYSDDD